MPHHNLTLQPHASLIAVSDDWRITHISENCSSLCSRSTDELLGSEISSIFHHEALHTIRNRLQSLGNIDAVNHVFGVKLFDAGTMFDVTVHRTPVHIIFEFEESTGRPETNALSNILILMKRLESKSTVQALSQEAASHLFALTRFDRVVISRFDEDGEAIVLSERKKFSIESLPAAQCVPATSFVRGYTTNRLHPISVAKDIAAVATPIATAADQSEPLDTTRCTSLTLDATHIEQMRGQGIRAGMDVHIATVAAGKIWGHICFHSYQPHIIPLAQRSFVELYVHMLSLIIAAREAPPASLMDS